MSSLTGAKCDRILIDDLPQVEYGKILPADPYVRRMEGLRKRFFDEYAKAAQPWKVTYKEKHMECPRCGAPVAYVRTVVCEDWVDPPAGEDVGKQRKCSVTYTCGTVVRTDKRRDRVKRIGDGCT